MRRILRGGRVVDPSQEIDEVLDLLVEDGRVAELGQGLEAGADCEAIDVGGLVVTPGLVDAHVHLREPGEEEKETLRTGMMAAAAGGFTTVACMADTQPVNDQRSVTEMILREASRHPFARVRPIGALSKGMAGEELAEVGEMVAAGAVAISDADRPVANPTLLRRALQYAHHYDVPVFERSEDRDLASGGVMHEGPWSARLGLPGRPALAEEVAVARNLLLASATGGRLHLTQISTRSALQMVREARQRGVQVTCDVSPHHLVLTDQSMAESGFDTSFKTLPPFRSEADRDALRLGLEDGTIHAIASDHSPHDPDTKDVQFSTAPSGILGLETTLSLCLDQLVRPGHLELSRLIELLSTGPAQVLGLEAGSLEPGKVADITLIDLERRITVEPDRFRSLSRNSPFGGWDFQGAAAGTLLAGEPVELPAV